MSSGPNFANPSLFDSLRNPQDTVVSQAISSPVAVATSAVPAEASAKIDRHKHAEPQESRTITTRRTGGVARTRRVMPGVTKEQGGAAYLSARQLAERFSVGVATIWRWTNTMVDFPKPIELSPGTTRWAVVDVLAFEQIRRGK